jgi:ATP-binding cassette, subfamily F, member 3
MRDRAEALEENVVAVRREDESLKNFGFPFSDSWDSGALLEIRKVSTRCPKTGDIVANRLRNGPVSLLKGSRVQIKGPNGIGKTTLLELLVKGEAAGVVKGEGAKIGYYRQDFHNFDFEATVIKCLEDAAICGQNMQEIRKVAAGFFLKDKIVFQQVKTLSEGQKALLSLACLVLQRPSVLVMDEPTNHVNFRHLPAVAAAVKEFPGAVVVVSHDHDFVDEVDCEIVIDLGWELEAQEAAARAA